MAEAKQDRRDRGRGGGPPEFPELLQRAEALVPVLRERAGKAEELRRLPDETIEDLHRSGLFRILQPRRVGGSELPFRSIVELGSVISRGDGSTGWVLANLAAHHWLLGMWPKSPLRPLERLFPILWFGFWINLFTGISIFMKDANAYGHNLDLGVKLVFVAIGLWLMAVIRKQVFGDPTLDAKPVTSHAKMLAWASLLSWFGAIIAGRLIAYVGPVPGL